MTSALYSSNEYVSA